MTDAPEPSILVRAEGGVGRLTLNRPRAINALDLGMARLIAEALDGWEHEHGIALVLLDGAGERGLCAGGDVRGLAAQVASGDAEGAGVFFRAEYALNARIAEYPKPIVVFADGITMGGGIGLAGHAAIRIVTERSQLAMPETRIGFTPDVGGTWLLAHAPGRLGEYLGMTGVAMDAADAVYTGFADYLVPSERLGDLKNELVSVVARRFDSLSLAQRGTRRDETPKGEARFVSSIRSLIDDRGETPPASRLESAREWIDDAFSADTVADVVERLRARPEPEAAATADLLDELSPTGLAVTLASIRRARGLPDLRAALAQEYGLVMWFAQTQPDLVEGIRAQLIDKDRSPRWQPATTAELAPGAADAAFDYEPRTPLWR